MRLVYILGCLCLVCCHSSEPALDLNRPNIVYILADDLGYGDISAYNPQGKIQTPHIDALTEGGMMFTDAHSGSSVCSPTRYGVLTGRYAWRSRLKHGVTWSWDQPLISNDQTTVASFLKKQGYKTGCIGKWHLGLGWQQDSNGMADIRKPLQAGPTDLGFDYFFGITASLDIPPYIYIQNNQSTTQLIDTIEKRDGKEFWRRGQIGADFTHTGCLPRLTEEAVDFINREGTGNNPFFLYFPLPAPHTPILPTEKFKGASHTNAFGDFVLMVDDVVGQIMHALRENNQQENTLIIFTSDNGCSPMADFAELAEFGHNPSHIYRGHKADIFEGGHRVPFSVRWPAKIKPNSKSSETICLTDLLRTIADIVDIPLRDDEGVDSYSFLPILQGKPAAKRPATVHHSINGSYAIRSGDWKLIFCPGSGGWSEPLPKNAYADASPALQLYNLKNDPGEQNNLVDEHSERVRDLTSLMEQFIRQGRSTDGASQNNDEATRLYHARDRLMKTL